MKTGTFYMVWDPFEKGSLAETQQEAEARAEEKRATWQSRPEIAAKVRVTSHAYPEVPSIDGYTEEHRELIQSEIQDQLIQEITSGGWISCSWSDRLVDRGPQRFAVFGPTAYELLQFKEAGDEKSWFEYQPVVIGGRMFRMDPEEGRGGMLYLMHMTKRRGQPADAWMTSYLQQGWLRTEELEMTNEQILDNIVEEISAGHNVLTKKPPGWA